jgi:hypothetical protein
MPSLEEIKENLPFVSAIQCLKVTYIGIVQNSGDKFITFYDYEALKSANEKAKLLELGSIWWNESNRLLPISVFLPGQLANFRYCLKTVNAKESEILFGPVTSLSNLVKKRTKKIQVQLVREM